jgi:hypothetical protein
VQPRPIHYAVNNKHKGNLMKICTLTCAAAIAAAPVSAQELGFVIDLLPGHPVNHQSEQEAGVVMAISITPERGSSMDLKELCEDLRLAAGLESRNAAGFRLEVIFIVPYKGMAVEGYYLPVDNALDSGTLVPGNRIARERLDGIVAGAGIPAGLLDETDVEHEISCETSESAWLMRWEDIRPVGSEGPDQVIASAQRRFMAVHQSIVDRAMEPPRAMGQQSPDSMSPRVVLQASQDR